MTKNNGILNASEYFFTSASKDTHTDIDFISHDTCEILLVVDGAGILATESGKFSLTPGTLALIPREVSHKVSVLDSQQFERYILRFDAQAPLVETQELSAKIFGDTCEALCAASFFSSLTSTFMRLERAKKLPETERNTYERLLISELLVLISTMKYTKKKPDESTLGISVANYINENIDAPLSLDRLASRFFVSKFYLCRAFKKKNGTSIHNYITKKRLSYAQALIDAGETASGAAYKVGFGDYSAFYRAYLKEYGTSPTEQK